MTMMNIQIVTLKVIQQVILLIQKNLNTMFRNRFNKDVVTNVGKLYYFILYYVILC